MPPPFSDPAIAKVFGGFEPDTRAGLLQLRAMIFDVATAEARIGEVSETLKWGQPSYVPKRANVGTPVRLAATDGGFALLVHCQTTIVGEFRALFPDVLEYDGNRAVVFRRAADIHADCVSQFIQRALKYKLS
ncbi:DUF1801 domain-containing protein [Falsihalocynthiibacter sp. SS001]|uniref:DUF1801 domain-containing protein n=1 Tax=Falsihalocynthiibacter sp. SS001 TaxID=3349698 RepID=UPI0036D34803